jgi:hypothetical protein
MRAQELPVILLFTDFGTRDPYVGQVKARLIEDAPGVPVIDLLHDVPDFNPHAGAHLLAALAPRLPPGSVFLAVVDPGVGTSREAVVLEAGGRWYVGPDNGLLSVVAAREPDAKVWQISWRPDVLTATFHGRDLFAPIAARIARGDFPAECLRPVAKLEVEFDANDLARVIYIDHYGNAWTGVRDLPSGSQIHLGRRPVHHAETFGFVERGQPFWFINSVGLIEVAVNRGHAATVLGIKVGDAVQLTRPN